MKTSVWSLTCQRSVFQRYYSGKHLSEFYPQDGGESQLASKYVTVALCIGLHVIFKPKNFVKVASHTFTRVRFLISLFRLFLTHCSHARYLSSRMLIRFIWQWIHSTQYYFWRRVGRPFLHKKWQSITGIATRSLLPALFHTLIFTISLLLSFIQVHQQPKKKLSSSLDDELWSRSSNLTYRGPGVKMMNHLPNI